MAEQRTVSDKDPRLFLDPYMGWCKAEGLICHIRVWVGYLAVFIRIGNVRICDARLDRHEVRGIDRPQNRPIPVLCH